MRSPSAVLVAVAIFTVSFAALVSQVIDSSNTQHVSAQSDQSATIDELERRLLILEGLCFYAGENLGEFESFINEGVMKIYSGTGFEGYQQTIGGVTYSGYDVIGMTTLQRRDLANQWAVDNGAADSCPKVVSNPEATIQALQTRVEVLEAQVETANSEATNDLPPINTSNSWQTALGVDAEYGFHMRCEISQGNSTSNLYSLYCERVGP